MNQNPARALTGTLGVGSIVFMVVAAAAPLTVVAGAVPLGVALGTGAAFPATFLICAAVLVPFAVGFCAMTRHVPEAGAFYAYIQRGLGSAPGLGPRSWRSSPIRQSKRPSMAISARLFQRLSSSSAVLRCPGGHGPP